MKNDLDRLDALAAGYVLGTLDDTDRRYVKLRLARDNAFTRLTEAWSERLAPLAAALPPVEPPAGLWRRIEAALPPAQVAAPLQSGIEALRRQALAWRWTAVAASAVAAVLALSVATTVREPPRAGRYLALLESGPARPAWAVTLDLVDGTLSARPLGRPAAVEGAYELWLVPADGGAPRSLGLLAPERNRPIPVPPALLADTPRATALAVSLEPAGGSPTGQPTGPVLYQGGLLALAD